MQIQTVLGPISPEALGITLMHEHTFCDAWEWGGHGYDYLLRTFIPMLKEQGLGESEIHRILVENPRRALAF